jgi:hypothetical protein
MEPVLLTILIMVAVGVGGAIALHFIAQVEDASVRSIARIGVIALVVIVLLILLWRLVVHSGAVSGL